MPSYPSDCRSEPFDGQPELEIRKRIYDAIAKADNFGATPMFVACQQGHLKVCK